MTIGEQVPEGPVESVPSTERKGQRTRRRILDAARAVFAEVGYERATIRGIAAAAGVDKSSIIKYFGTKQALFHEAVHWDIPVAELSTDDAGQTTENYARAMLTAWAADPNSPMAVLLRTSMTSEDAADILRRHITTQGVDAVAATIDASDARLRAAVAGAILMGIASQRFILRMPDLVNADIDDILRLVTPLLRSLIDPE
ncbi:putative transcriptional regulator, TetR family protein [Mycobacterium marinum]|uniref:TetR/AcrR family transcriptional regulator n=1 Tax=Mycobacterium marinum TaxID=1781 RepID=UPI0021C25CC2|nr:TetR family transcriptional regulator [Mycobacterium marinum]GJN99083.1 putative transcriptional regulator, TetR family protein [Mycobacterium marinum]